MVPSELGTIVEGHGVAQGRRDGVEERTQKFGDIVGCLVGRLGGEEKSGMAFVDGEDGLTVSGEEDEIGFPMSRGAAVDGSRGPQRNGNPACDEACRTAALAAAEAAFAFAARQKKPPPVVVGAGDLGVNEAVDGFMADYLSPVLLRQAAGDLFRRPSPLETIEDLAAQLRLALQPRSRSAPGAGLLVGVARLVADLPATVAFHFTSDCRWRAIQSCRDLPDRAPIGLKSGYLTPVFQ